MKTFKPTVEPIIAYQWSRTHANWNTYLTIEQKAFIIVNNSIIEVKSGKIGDIPKYVEIQELAKRTDAYDFTAVKESMSKENIATNDYTHFRVILANGREIICSSYAEFLQHIEAKA